MAHDTAMPNHLRPWPMFRRGLLVNLTNPKAIVFLLAFTPQFIRLDGDLVAQYLVFTLTVVTIDIIVMWFFFALAARVCAGSCATPPVSGWSAASSAPCSSRSV